MDPSPQQAADRIRLLREELSAQELKDVLALTPEQQSRFDDWSRAKIAELAQRFDVDTSSSQARVSWGMRIASTLGGLAICAALMLVFARYWGYLDTWAQVAIVVMLPLIALAGAAFAAKRERTLYFTSLVALVAFAAFMMNLFVLGSIFNIVSTAGSLLAWGAFALAVAYRYGLRVHLALGLLLLIAYGAALITERLGHRWFDFDDRPELFLLFALLVFSAPLGIRHERHANFPPVYRLVGAIVFFTAVLSLADLGISSYLPWEQKNVERFYEFVGLLSSAGGIWLGIARQWRGVVNASASAFVIFLFMRLYSWWWESMPKYLFFAIIGALAIGLVLGFQKMRRRMAESGGVAA